MALEGSIEFGWHTGCIRAESKHVPRWQLIYQDPRIICYHSTESRSIEETLEMCLRPDIPFGSHFIVDRNGDIYQTVRTYERPMTLFHTPMLPDHLNLIDRSAAIDQIITVGLQMRAPKLSKRGRVRAPRNYDYDIITKRQYLSVVDLTISLLEHWGSRILRLDSRDGMDDLLDRAKYPNALENPGPGFPLHLLQKRLLPKPRPKATRHIGRAMPEEMALAGRPKAVPHWGADLMAVPKPKPKKRKRTRTRK